MLFKFWVLVPFLFLFNSVSRAQTVGNTNRVPYATIFSSSFNTRRELRTWDKRPSRRWCRLIDDSIGNSVLRVRSADNVNRLLQKNLPVEQMAGRKVLIRVRLRTGAINGRTLAYNGVKVALHTISPAGDSYPQLQIPFSELSWQSAGFTAIIPSDITSCTLLLGLEGVSGEAFFDDVSVSLFPVEGDVVLATEKQATVSDTIRILRGAMVPPYISAEDLRVLASWGANHVRWQLTWSSFPDSPADTASIDAYKAWLHNALTHLHSLMPLCDSLGLKVLIDLHTFPGGRRVEAAGQEHRIFSDKAAQTAFREAWVEIARNFQKEPALWGYDLANEPIEGYLPDSVLDWQSLIAATAADIQAIDPVHHIILEGAPSGGPQAMLTLLPLKHVSQAVYSFHMYEPNQFTHQGIYGLPAGVHYPGVIEGRNWNKDTLRKILQPVRDWQLRHGTSVYVGEFSAVRWAPDSSAFNYIRDCIDIFENWGWSWAYHAFREWNGWSVEHDGDPEHQERANQPTDRQLLLMETFKKNRRSK